jgi:uncharacterized surface protein with fasciclin (FAS1) repeats
MKKIAIVGFIVASVAGMALATPASHSMKQEENTVMVGGNAMFPKKNIVENAINSKDHTILVAAVKAAGLVDTLAGKGPFTVFAPVDSAFKMLPDGTVDTLLKPENKDQLVKILTYHVVAGRYDSMALKSLIKKGNGTGHLKAVSGGELTFKMNGPTNIVVMDENGGTANFATYDVVQSNGVIHVIDHVLLPR